MAIALKARGVVKDRGASWRAEPSPASPQALAACFESLGDNCEFAAFQRGVGVDQLAFFRWSSTSMPMLLQALDEDLAAGVDRSALRLELAGANDETGREYIVVNDRYGTQAHAFAVEGELTPDVLIEREWRRLTLLRRKFLEDAQAARRIYVFRSDQPMHLGPARELHRALRLKGPNALVRVGLADANHPAGTVEIVEDGLAFGYIDYLAPASNGAYVKSQLWPLILGRAYRLLRCPRREKASQILAQTRQAWTRSLAS